MIRVGDRWLADSPPATTSGSTSTGRSSRRCPPRSRPGEPIRAGRACSAAPSLYEQIEERLTALLGCEDSLVLPTITHIHMSVIPLLAASRHDLPRRARAQDDLRRLPGGQVARRRDPPVQLRGPGSPRCAAARRARSDRDRVHGRRQLDDRQPAGPAGVRRRGSPPRRAAVRRRRARLRRDRRARAGRDVALRRCAETASCATSATRTRTSSSSAASRSPTRRYWHSSRCPTEIKEMLKVAAPPYLYSGPSPVASLATVLAGFDVNERRGDVLRAELHRALQQGRRGPARDGRRDAEPLGPADRRDPGPRSHATSTSSGASCSSTASTSRSPPTRSSPRTRSGSACSSPRRTPTRRSARCWPRIGELAARGELRPA